MSAWPTPKVMCRALNGTIAEIIKTKWGTGKGVRSAHSWIYFIVAGDKSLVFCEHCEEREYAPDPPGAGAPGETRNALVAPGTQSHALYILTWLHKWTAQHKGCERKQDA